MKHINSIHQQFFKSIGNKVCLIIITIFVLSSYQASTFAQCSDASVKKYVATLVQNLPKNSKTHKQARFLKQYKLDKTNTRKKRNPKTNKYYLEYSYVCSKSTRYYITMDAASSPDIIIEVYDSSKNLVVSNYRSGRYMKGVGFPCKASGQYTFRFTFNGRSGCAASVLSFMR